MPVKIARSAPRASFGLPELLIASTPRASLATRPERREYSRQFGSHPGNPGLSLFSNAAFFQIADSNAPANLTIGISAEGEGRRRASHLRCGSFVQDRRDCSNSGQALSLE